MGWRTVAAVEDEVDHARARTHELPTEQAGEAPSALGVAHRVPRRRLRPAARQLGQQRAATLALRDDDAPHAGRAAVGGCEEVAGAHRVQPERRAGAARGGYLGHERLGRGPPPLRLGNALELGERYDN